jgi:hypothetical protein
MTGKPFRRKNNGIISDEAGTKKRPPVAQKEEEVGDDFQGYHHRRQKELNIRVLIFVITVNPLLEKKRPANINHRQKHILGILKKLTDLQKGYLSVDFQHQQYYFGSRLDDLFPREHDPITPVFCCSVN